MVSMVDQPSKSAKHARHQLFGPKPAPSPDFTLPEGCINMKLADDSNIYLDMEKYLCM